MKLFNRDNQLVFLKKKYFLFEIDIHRFNSSLIMCLANCYVLFFFLFAVKNPSFYFLLAEYNNFFRFQINELYELCNRAKEKSDTLTNIIERMTALESLHRQGKNFFFSNCLLRIKKIRTFLSIIILLFEFCWSIFRFTGKQSVQTITHLETLQAEIATKLANNNALLNNVKENLSSNISVIKDNVESLKTRVENLLSKR